MVGGMDRQLFGRWFTACKLEKRACIYAVIGQSVARVELDMLTADYRLRAPARKVVEELFLKLGDYSALRRGQSPGDIGPRICLNRRVKLDRLDELCAGLVELAAVEVREQLEEAEGKSTIKSRLVGEDESPGGIALPRKRGPGLSSSPGWQKVRDPRLLGPQ